MARPFAALLLFALGSTAEASFTAAALKAAVKTSLREVAEAAAKASRAFLDDKPVKAALPDSELVTLRQRVAGELRGEAAKTGLAAEHDPVKELQAARDAAALLQQGCEGCTPGNPGPADLLHKETIRLVAEKLGIREKADVDKLVALYGSRIRRPGAPKTEAARKLEAEAAERLLASRRLSPDASKELMSRVTAMANGLKPQGVLDGMLPIGATLGTVTAEQAALTASAVPRHQLRTALSRRVDVSAPQVSGNATASTPLAGNGVVALGVANLQTAAMLEDDGTLTGWTRIRGQQAKGIGQVIWGKVTDGKTYSDWWDDAKSVGRSFTAEDDYWGWKNLAPAAWEGGKAIAGSVWQDFKTVGTTAVEYAKKPTSSKGADLTGTVFMAGLNLVGLGMPAVVKGSVQTTVKAGVTQTVKTTVRETAENAAEAAVKTTVAATEKGAVQLAAAAGPGTFDDFVRRAMPNADPAKLTPVQRKVLEGEYAKKTAKAAATAQPVAAAQGFDEFARGAMPGRDPASLSDVERKALEAAYRRQGGVPPEPPKTDLPTSSAGDFPETPSGKILREFAEQNGVSPADAEAAFAAFARKNGFSAGYYDKLEPAALKTQMAFVLKSPGFRDALPVKPAGSFANINPQVSESALAQFRASSIPKMTGRDLNADGYKLYRHIGKDELRRALNEGGLIPQAFKETGAELGPALRRAGGMEGLIKNRVIDNPEAKRWLYEFTEHAERSGLGPQVSSAGAIKIQIVPKANQEFVSTGQMSKSLLDRSERGWATMDPISADQIKLFGPGCDAGCMLTSEAGRALASRILTSK